MLEMVAQLVAPLAVASHISRPQFTSGQCWKYEQLSDNCDLYLVVDKMVQENRSVGRKGEIKVYERQRQKLNWSSTIFPRLFGSLQMQALTLRPAVHWPSQRLLLRVCWKLARLLQPPTMMTSFCQRWQHSTTSYCSFSGGGRNRAGFRQLKPTIGHSDGKSTKDFVIHGRHCSTKKCSLPQ